MLVYNVTLLPSLSLQLKEEALDYLEAGTLQNLVKKYSQFIHFNIFLWASKVLTLICLLKNLL